MNFQTTFQNKNNNFCSLSVIIPSSAVFSDSIILLCLLPLLLSLVLFVAASQLSASLATLIAFPSVSLSLSLLFRSLFLFSVSVSLAVCVSDSSSVSSLLLYHCYYRYHCYQTQHHLVLRLMYHLHYLFHLWFLWCLQYLHHW